ncbi:MAG: DUF1071 domain-containing protein [Muribaculaceae bacterium]|nr:DUF1071 domain-containing protein [Muribaculaceae bacterium]
MNFEDFSPVIPDTKQEVITNQEKARETFKRLYSLNLNDQTETKNNMVYLNWATAYKQLKLAFPDAVYRVLCHPETHLPYFPSELGIFVMVEITAGGLTYQQHLPVLNESNKAMKEHPYTYTVYNKYEKRYDEKTVAACTSFDINSALMRALTKCISQTGIGLYIYEGNDMPYQLPSSNDEASTQAEVANNTVSSEKRTVSKRKKTTPIPSANPVDPYAGIRGVINSMTNMADLTALFNVHSQEAFANPEILAMFSQRRAELEAA